MNSPYQPHLQSPKRTQIPRQQASVGVNVLAPERGRLPLPISVIVSLGLHLLTIGFLILVIYILQLLGFNIPLLEAVQPKQRDVTFVLVERPEAQPRNKNTRNRADRATRSGGKKINDREADASALQGTPSQQSRAAQPTPAQPQSRPQPQRPQQQRPQPQRPQPQPRQQQQPQRQQPQRPQPPAPKMPTPTRQPNPSPAAVPNPVAPNIKLPAAPTPKAIATGPIVRTPSGSSRSGSSSSSPGPSQIPGSVGGGSQGNPGSRGGGSSGQNGGQSYSSAGSPGGGGGTAGIDALPEADFGPYIAELQRRIKRNWNPPADKRNKRVVAIFTIHRDGRLLNVRITQSSGFSSADNAATAAVRASAPFRPLPTNFRGSQVDINFTFDYTVSGSYGG